MFVFWGKHKYRYGLVLSGGGAKGAYQIGAFKALEELGRDVTPDYWKEA